MEALTLDIQTSPSFDEEHQCWECGAFVPAPQRVHAMTTLDAIICGHCEPFVRHTLRLEQEGATA